MASNDAQVLFHDYTDEVTGSAQMNKVTAQLTTALTTSTAGISKSSREPENFKNAIRKKNRVSIMPTLASLMR